MNIFLMPKVRFSLTLNGGHIASPAPQKKKKKGNFFFGGCSYIHTPLKYSCLIGKSEHERTASKHVIIALGTI